jgi:glycosyltransferase involved in cell wall biosynthesis
LLKLVTEKGLRDKIRILGWVPEEKLHLYYEAADIFVLSSEYEGFPISLLEALAFGAACVSSDISPMILSDGLNGLIFQRGNVAHLVNKLKMLMDDQELRISVSKAGRELAEQYDWDKVAAETKTVYEALLSSSPVDF